VDLILPMFDDRVDPTEIQPVNARARRYVKRDVLKDNLVRILRDASPAPLSTNVLSLVLRHRLGIEFATKEQLKAWVRTVLQPQLTSLAQEGVLERVRLTDNQADFVYWRVAMAQAAVPQEEFEVALIERRRAS